ncbi:hypothetical protein HN451_03705 [archaeon]|nr:hypothetical protein [archaeon]
MLKNRIDHAQDAYHRRDLKGTKEAHTKKAIHASMEEHQKSTGKYLGDWVYGALDGIITTFAVVSGVAGAHLSSAIVLILGFANLLADGLSMGVGNYISPKSELEYIRRERRREEWEIEHYPEGETEEIRAIYKKKGFKGKDLDRVVKVITSDKKVWVDTMMFDELGLVEEDKTPFKSGVATFVAFLIAGFVPLIAYVVSYFIPGLLSNAYYISIVFTAIILFIVGALRHKLTGQSFIKSGMEMLIIGGLAASVSYLVGFLLQGLA